MLVGIYPHLAVAGPASRLWLLVGRALRSYLLLPGIALIPLYPKCSCSILGLGQTSCLVLSRWPMGLGPLKWCLRCSIQISSSRDFSCAAGYSFPVEMCDSSIPIEKLFIPE